MIGIIALLIGILLPTLSKARESARAVACGSNMRQIGQATFLYATNTDGVLPYGLLFINETTYGGVPSPYEGFTTWYHQYGITLGQLDDPVSYIPSFQDPFPGVYRCPSVDSTFQQPLTIAQHMVAMPPTFYMTGWFNSTAPNVDQAIRQEGRPARA